MRLVGWIRVMGLIQLHKAYGSTRLNKACEIALKADMVSYRRIKNILKNNMDKNSLFYQDLEENKTTHIPVHQNIRGAVAYQ